MSIWLLAPTVIATLVFVAWLAIAAYAADQPRCYAKWKDSGLDVRWSLQHDCELSYDGREWVTERYFVRKAAR